MRVCVALVSVLVLLPNEALGDGSSWRRIPRRSETGKGCPAVVGDPALIGNDSATSFERTTDLKLELPLGRFFFERTRIGNANLLGAIDGSNNAVCAASILSGVTVPRFESYDFRKRNGPADADAGGYDGGGYGYDGGFDAGGFDAGGSGGSDAGGGDGGYGGGLDAGDEDWYFRGAIALHSLYSFVDTRCPTHTRVLTPDGDVRFFGPSPTAIGHFWVPRSSDAPGEVARLQVERVGPNPQDTAFALQMEDGRIFIYAYLSPGLFFLSKVYNSDRLLVATLAMGTAGPCAATGITSASFPETSRILRLRYSGYLSSCWLSQLDVEGGTTVPSVEYQYVWHSNRAYFVGRRDVGEGVVHRVSTEFDGLVEDTSQLRFVVLDDTGLQSEEVRARHYFSSGSGDDVTRISDLTGDHSVAPPSTPVDAICTNCCTTASDSSRKAVLVTDGSAYRGDGTGLGAASTQKIDFYGYSASWQLNGSFAPEVARVTRECDANSSCASGVTEFVYGQVGTTAQPADPTVCGDQVRPTARLAVKDSAGAYWATPKRIVSVALGSSSLGAIEQVKTETGASSSAGSGALESVSHVFTYDAFGSQLKSADVISSVLVAGDTASTSYVYDASGRPAGIIRSGFTRSLAGAATRVYVGTFLRRTARPCSQTSVPSGSDRVYALEGPCIVAPGATSCSGTFPVTEFEYFGEPAVSVAGQTATTSGYFNDGMLARANTYPGGCSSTALTTAFASYDARGHAQLVLEPNSLPQWHANWTFEYAGDKLIKISTPMAEETSLTWSHGHLVGIRFPENDELRACYFEQGSDPLNQFPRCDQQIRVPWTELSPIPFPRWVGRVSPDGTPIEVSEYEYWNDGTVKSVSTYTYVGGVNKELFSQVAFGADADGRPTFEKVGTGNWFTVRGFSSRNELTGIGGGYGFVSSGGLPSTPPYFCRSGGVPSALCAQMQFDRAGRLSVATMPNDSSTPASLTCLDYDRAGNISRVKRGCSPSQCVPNTTPTTIGANGHPTAGGSASCSAPETEYVWDDFGNVVSVFEPGSAGASERRFEYDAMGNVVKEQSARQRSESSQNYTSITYDQLGRKLSTREFVNGTPTVLSTQAWDTAPAIPAGCGYVGTSPGDAKTKGRLAFETSPIWNTWYGYDGSGRLISELRVDVYAASCVSSADHNATAFWYRRDGRVSSITYPSGRVVTYHYPGAGGDPTRPSGVSVGVFDTPTHQNAIVMLSGITWWPDNTIRAYDMLHYPGLPVGGTTATFETNVKYEKNTDAIATKPSSCWGTPAYGDFSGRLRSVNVFSKTYNADIYMRTYTWMADEIVSIDNCYYGMTAPQNEFTADGPYAFESGYDRNARLKSVRQTAPSLGSPNSTREYAYDLRGNRTSLGIWGATAIWGYASTLTAGTDQLSEVAYETFAGGVFTPSPTSLDARLFNYDADGRVYGAKTRNDSTGYPNYTLSFWYPGGGVGGAGTQGVIRVVSVNGLAFTYFYDGRNRRIQKQYPAGQREQFFYLPGGRLLAERSFESYSNTNNVLDEYIYLGGRPVMQFRSRYSDAMTRLDDWAASCKRRDEDATCGTYFLVTDHLSRPVYVLNKDFALTGVGEYDPFGHVNRVAGSAETAHPYGTTSSTLVVSAGQPKFAYDINIRVRFPFVDTENSTDFAQVTTSSGDTFAVSGPHAGAKATTWLPTSNGTFGVSFTANTNPTAHSGVVYGGYEYQRFGVGAKRYFPPLRFPNHYYDAETDLFENWNRYYDPATGRYLSPEPLLQSPAYISTMASSGFSVPTYAYAANNPLRYVDPNGLEIRLGAGRELGRVAARLQSTATGQRLWNLLQSRKEVIRVEEMKMRWFPDNSWRAGETTALRNNEMTCRTITNRSFERLWWTRNGQRLAMDPAAVLGHELFHAWARLYGESTNPLEESVGRDVMKQIQLELETIEGAGP